MLFGVFIYDGVEPIDLATFGVLSMARRIRPDIEICTIAPRAGVDELGQRAARRRRLRSRAAPQLDVLIVTGGRAGSRRADRRRRWPSFAAAPRKSCRFGLHRRHDSGSERCPGWQDGDHQARSGAAGSVADCSGCARTIQISMCAKRAWSTKATIITGGGVSLCIDTMLHLLKKLLVSKWRPRPRGSSNTKGHGQQT